MGRKNKKIGTKTLTAITVILMVMFYSFNIISCMGLFSEDQSKVYTNSAVGIIAASFIGMIVAFVFLKTHHPLAFTITVTASGAIIIAFAVYIYSIGIGFANVSVEKIGVFLRNKCFSIIPVILSIIRFFVIKINATKEKEEQFVRSLRQQEDDLIL